MNKFLFTVIIILGFFFSSCTDEPQSKDEIPIKPLISVVANIESLGFNTPANPPEYLIINSARDLANLPEGTLAPNTEFTYSKIDYAKNSVIIVTTIIYCKFSIDDENNSWAIPNYTLTRDYQLNVKFTNCSVIPTVDYSYKCKMQFGFSVDKIPAETVISITESM